MSEPEENWGKEKRKGNVDWGAVVLAFVGVGFLITVEVFLLHTVGIDVFEVIEILFGK